MPKSLQIILLSVILILAGLLRIAYISEYRHTQVYPVLEQSDSEAYYFWAKDILSGDFGDKAFMKWPFYAFFLGFSFLFLGFNPATIYFLQFILGLASCFLVFLIGRKMFDARVGLVSAFLCSFYGLFIFYENLLVYTSLSTFLNLLLFFFLLQIKDNLSKKNILLFGILLGICTLTQANIALFGILAVAWLLIRNKTNLRKSASLLVCFLAGLVLIVGAVTLRNYIVEKDFVPIAGNLGFNFYSGNNPQATGTFYSPESVTFNQEDMFRDARIIAENAAGRQLKTSEVSNYWLGKSFDFIRHNPDQYLKLMLKKTLYVFGAREIVHDIEYKFIQDKIRVFKFTLFDLRFILPFIIFGVVLGLRRIRESMPLYLVVITLAFSIVLFFVTARYRISIVPFLMIFAGLGIIYLWEMLKARNFSRLILLIVLMIAIFFLGNIKWARGTKYSLFEHHMSLARECESKQDFKNAMQELNLASQVEPQNRRAIFRLAVIYHRLNDLANAESGYKEVIKVSPLSVDAYYNLGLIYNQEQRYLEAVEVLKQVVNLDPDDARAHFELGIAYQASGRVKEAKEEFTLALAKINRWRKADRDTIKEKLANLK